MGGDQAGIEFQSKATSSRLCAKTKSRYCVQTAVLLEVNW